MSVHVAGAQESQDALEWEGGSVYGSASTAAMRRRRIGPRNVLHRGIVTFPSPSRIRSRLVSV